ncbi:ribose-5-phosphate isomerase A [Shigella flexneri]
MKGQIEGAVSSSDASTEKLKSLGIHVFRSQRSRQPWHLRHGADEINGHMQIIKGGGAALTRKKVIASVAEKFICIADASPADIQGHFPAASRCDPDGSSAVARQW